MSDKDIRGFLEDQQVYITLSNLFIIISAVTRVFRMLKVTDFFGDQVQMLLACLQDLGQFTFFFFLMIFFFMQTFNVLGVTWDEQTYSSTFDHGSA